MFVGVCVAHFGFGPLSSWFRILICIRTIADSCFYLWVCVFFYVQYVLKCVCLRVLRSGYIGIWLTIKVSVEMCGRIITNPCGRVKSGWWSQFVVSNLTARWARSSQHLNVFHHRFVADGHIGFYCIYIQNIFSTHRMAWVRRSFSGNP